MILFIDTNVLLDFFRMSSGDLEELRKVVRLVENQRIELLVSDHSRDEFFRNRERVIRDSLQQFRKSEVRLHRPNLIRVYPESLELERLRVRFDELKGLVTDQVASEASERSTQADAVIGELLEAAELRRVSEELIDRAIRRTSLGRPPGKGGSHGDAIHWEWLLQEVPEEDDLHLVSRDGDFESPLARGELSMYLADEWSQTKNSVCRLYLSLSDFLEQHFPHIRLSGEVDRQVAIEKLEKSPNFKTTHNAIARLLSIDDFTPQDLKRLILAYQTNTQIVWILDDRDVRRFAEKLVELAYEAELIEDVYPIEEMLTELEAQEAQEDDL